MCTSIKNIHLFRRKTQHNPPAGPARKEVPTKTRIEEAANDLFAGLNLIPVETEIEEAAIQVLMVSHQPLCIPSSRTPLILLKEAAQKKVVEIFHNYTSFSTRI